MNSRQRRKQAARNHSALLVEKAAYREDRVRDPEKYNIWENKSVKKEAVMSKAMIAMTISNYHIFDHKE